MKYFRYPVNFYTNDINSLCVDICSFLGCSDFLFDNYKIPLSDSFLIAPIRKFIVNGSKSFTSDFTRFRISGNFFDAIDKIKNIDNLVARGYYLPHTYSHPQLPTLIIYKQMNAYGNKPVIISENLVRPGEFILVTENVEVIATISFYDEVNDTHTSLPNELMSISFFNKENYTIDYFLESSNFDNQKTINNKVYSYTDVIPHRFEKSFFEERTKVQPLLTEQFQFTQIFPVLNQKLHEELLHDIKQSTLWVKRHSDNFIQMSLDILEMSKLSDCPASITRIIEEIKKPETVQAISKISDISVKYVNEIYAYRMQNG